MAWPPQFCTDQAPAVENTLALKADPEFPSNFARTTRWCPDGSLTLSQCENRSFQLLNPTPANGLPTEPKVFAQPAAILDFLWYPTASPWDPPSFCFLASVRECPVRLLDATDGRLRASYKIVDHRERQVAPHSMAFNSSGSRIYCGFEDTIEVFDVAQPGAGYRIHTSPSKKSKDGLKGIISSLAFSPSYDSDIYAAGSFTPVSSNIALFSETDGEAPLLFLGGGPKRAVTQLRFNPTKPHQLFASFRRTNAIYCWDIRGNEETPYQVYTYDDDGGELTNQKRSFDIDFGGKWLSVGQQNGSISLFSLEDTEATEIHPSMNFKAHDDAIGSVTFHPHKPWLLSSSGSRHFDDAADSEGEDEDVEKEGVFKLDQTPTTRDSSLKVWDFSRGGEEKRMESGTL